MFLECCQQPFTRAAILVSYGDEHWARHKAYGSAFGALYSPMDASCHPSAILEARLRFLYVPASLTPTPT